MNRWLRRILLLLVAVLVFFLIRRYIKIPTERSSALTHEFESKDSLRFFALGDTGSGDKNQMKVAQWMEDRCQKKGGIDGILLLGDHFYMTGVKSVEDPQWQQKIEKPYGKPCLSRSKIFPTFGNHDYKGNTQAQIQYSAMSSRWFMPYRFYRLDFGDLLRVVVFDSNFPDFCLLPNSCSLDFLHKQLSSVPTKWNLVTSHFPLASASKKKGKYRGDTMLAKVLKTFFCDKAQVWLSGHAHHLEHRQQAGCSTEIFVAGGGGGGVDPAHLNQKESKFVRSAFGFLEIEVDERKMVFRFIGKSGEEIYEHIKEADE